MPSASGCTATRFDATITTCEGVPGGALVTVTPLMSIRSKNGDDGQGTSGRTSRRNASRTASTTAVSPVSAGSSEVALGHGGSGGGRRRAWRLLYHRRNESSTTGDRNIPTDITQKVEPPSPRAFAYANGTASLTHAPNSQTSIVRLPLSPR